MTINSLSEQPRIANGTFTNKEFGSPEVLLTHPVLPPFDPNFFFERVSKGSAVEVSAETQKPADQALIRVARQAVNDAWALDNGVWNLDNDEFETDNEGDHVYTAAFRDGDMLVAQVTHRDLRRAPYGSLIAFSAEGRVIGFFDDSADDFAEGWAPASDLRTQLLADLMESSADGSLGDQL